jgi:GT2 family glycosyltransferase
VSEVDVIVLDIDGGAMLQACVDSIRHQSKRPRRVIVFDNGSQVPVAQRLRGDITIHRSETNLGFTGGVNEAFRYVNAAYVALVNNDVVLDRDWLEIVVAALDADPKLAAVQTALRRDAKHLDGAGIDIRDGTYRQIQSLDVAAWGVSATAALYRVEALGDRVFDPRFFAYYEDVELCARLHQEGWKTAVLPQIKATHRGSQTAPLLGREARRLRTRNRYWVARLHPGAGRIRALLWEDVKLLLRGRSSLRGIMEGLFGTMNDER